MAKTFMLFIVLNIVTDIFVSGVDIAGHLAGLAGGFLVAYVTGVAFSKTSQVKRIISLIMLVVIAFVLFTIGMRAKF